MAPPGCAILREGAKGRGPLRQELGRFILTGLVNTFFSLSIIFGLKYTLDAGDGLANATGYIAGLFVSFLLNRSWSFGHAGRILPAAIRFVGAFLTAYGLNLAIVLYLIHSVGINSYIAQAAGLPPYTVTFFLLTKYFVFPDKARGLTQRRRPFD